ncbi:hypothetical protein B0H17DRAFT_1149394 [Mycena rosella]|uniref:Uncharacterized protein n=1 Tax=Mycena rosella TaxID=1033263 RepID=A0AAD7C2Z4_MYCRO|nr:hypothetical protein B0H17DRAFT_1149394 [Mycena rosella]
MGATGSYKYSPRHHNSHLTELAPGLGPSSCPICINAVCLPDRSPHHWIGIGHMDGESVERGWALLNQLSSETKEMGAGERRDTLDGMSSSWMWRAEKASKRSKRAKKAAKVCVRRGQWTSDAMPLPMLSIDFFLPTWSGSGTVIDRFLHEIELLIDKEVWRYRTALAYTARQAHCHNSGLHDWIRTQMARKRLDDIRKHTVWLQWWASQTVAEHIIAWSIAAHRAQYDMDQAVIRRVMNDLQGYNVGPTLLIISYDISCQYYKNGRLHLT